MTRKADQQPVVHLAAAQPEGAPERRGLRIGQAFHQVTNGPEELFQPREGQIMLGLHAGAAKRSHDGALGYLREYGGLTESGLATYH